MKSPAFQFYPDDFLGSGKVGTMTPEEVGVYLLLLCLDWNENGFVFDQKKLARWCRTSQAKFAKAWATVRGCFVERDGHYFNPRLELERAKQAANRAKKQAAAQSRWNAPAYAPALQVECSPSPIPSPSPVTTDNNVPSGDGTLPGEGQPDEAPETPPEKLRRYEYTPEFAACWAEYPSRGSGSNPKWDAFKAYRARKREGVGDASLLAGTRRYAAHCRESGKWGTELVLMARTFFGPSRRYEEPWAASADELMTDEWGNPTPAMIRLLGGQAA